MLTIFQIGSVSLIALTQKRFDRGPPNLTIILKIYMTLPMSYAAERNSSKLSIKSNMFYFSVLSVDHDITKSLL